MVFYMLNSISSVLPPELSIWIIFSIILVIALSSFIHGLIGVGFPLISTPLIAALTDIKTAVIITIVPNVILNLIIIFRKSDWRKTINKFIFIATCVTAGTMLGSKILIHSSEIFLKGILVFMLVMAVLTTNKKFFQLKQYNLSGKLSQFLFGFTAGIMGGAVNISVPFLTIYFTNTEYSPAVMSQAFNVCFIFSKISQAFILGIDGNFGLLEILIGIFLSLVAIKSQKPGLKLQDRISKEVYKKYLNIFTILITLFVSIDFIYSVVNL